MDIERLRELAGIQEDAGTKIWAAYDVDSDMTWLTDSPSAVADLVGLDHPDYGEAGHPFSFRDLEKTLAGNAFKDNDRVEEFSAGFTEIDAVLLTDEELSDALSKGLKISKGSELSALADSLGDEDYDDDDYDDDDW